jgi:hypothetical protein
VKLLEYVVEGRFEIDMVFSLLFSKYIKIYYSASSFCDYVKFNNIFIKIL